MGDQQRSWAEITANLDSLERARAGVTRALRGIVTLPDGGRVFVKIGTDDDTKRRAKKEIHTYRYLAERAYPHIPKIVAVNADQTGFALEPLENGDDWEWGDDWDKSKVDSLIQAIDMLAEFRPMGQDLQHFRHGILDESKNDWAPLAQSSDMQHAIRSKLDSIGYHELAATIDFTAAADRNDRFAFKHDALVHYDINAGNYSWNANSRQLRIIDWDWTQLGDRRVDQAAVLVHMCNTGVDVRSMFSERLDPDGLHWVAGYWLKWSLGPLGPARSAAYRTSQLRAGATAYTLSQELSS